MAARSRRPPPNDISGSHNWADKADLGLVVHRDPNNDPLATELYVRKVHFKQVGKTGVVAHRYGRATGRFSESPRRRPAPATRGPTRMIDHCLRCGQPYEPSRRGSPQRFCSIAHRRVYDAAARAWVRCALKTGLLCMADFQNAARKTRVFSTRPSDASPIPEPPDKRAIQRRP
jgi:hypothetical protein